ncbi:hypothetical protein CJF42_05945 [Pseudoalteromonas sp. NBT06-2]|uniref:MerC domain-containing protein n=1 Tax=Pseudoalteromonas sp. NBT06-2 TaxID=2025950 RepID=UPI000BA608FC|nr:MerC domain-containing protein [Pseudoalteromonas sp. NBT06-2]PAJ75301.1 hypothetical protein CJF42_05945 [Pseudoalteromonas sp. NBT06-2]
MKLQCISDKTAIGLSMLCIAHCLLIPILIILIPSISGILSFNNEDFHKQILYLMVIFSLIALFIGFLNHNKLNVFLLGCFGLLLLISAVLTKVQIFGSLTEVILTVLGSSIVAFSHVKNYQLRQQHSTKNTA